MWLLRPDGSSAQRLADRRPNRWFDASSAYYLDAPSGTVVRVALDGTSAVLTPPPGPRTGGSGLEGRRFMEVAAGGGRIAYHWVHDDNPGSGASVAPADLSTFVDLDQSGPVSVSPAGDRVVVWGGGGVWVYDGEGRPIGGPYAGSAVGHFGGWSSDDRHVVLASTDSCVLDVLSGSCTPTPLGHDSAIGASLLRDGATLVAGVFDQGAEDDRLVVGPAGGPLVTIAPHARFEYASPTDDRVVYSEFPFFHADRPDRVHVIDPDGSNDHVVATTSAGVLAMTLGCSPDGEWILVDVFVNRGGG